MKQKYLKNIKKQDWWNANDQEGKTGTLFQILPQITFNDYIFIYLKKINVNSLKYIHIIIIVTLINYNF